MTRYAFLAANRHRSFCRRQFCAEVAGRSFPAIALACGITRLGISVHRQSSRICTPASCVLTSVQARIRSGVGRSCSVCSFVHGRRSDADEQKATRRSKTTKEVNGGRQTAADLWHKATDVLTTPSSIPRPAADGAPQPRRTASGAHAAENVRRGFRRRMAESVRRILTQHTHSIKKDCRISDSPLFFYLRINTRASRTGRCGSAAATRGTRSPSGI